MLGRILHGFGATAICWSESRLGDLPLSRLTLLPGLIHCEYVDDPYNAKNQSQWATRDEDRITLYVPSF